MSPDEYVTSESWLNELLHSYAVEVRARSLTVHTELDSELYLRRDGQGEAALERLFRFVFSAVPDGCEVYVASARNDSPVAALGSGALTLRWQVAGNPSRPIRGKVTAIRPIAGAAVSHVQSTAAKDLERAFHDAGWSLDLTATSGDRELWARASTR
jgi:hypothetical protein